MTWKELKDKISLMTEEEQQKEVAVWGENMNKNIINNAQLLEIKTKIRQLGAMMNAYQCRFVVS